MPTLFEPLTLGDLEVPNRIFMAPVTRTRGTKDFVPTDLMIEYYRQRAGAGLIVSEAIGISARGLGQPYATGLWRADQIAGWRRVTDAVHLAGGRIFAQIWHMGRLVHPSFAQGAQPVSASATRAPGRAHTYAGRDEHACARALSIREIPALVEEFRRAARNAIAAGFDGIQIHAANGYLLDQFLRDNSNFRLDGYGGSITHRMRLLLDVCDAVCAEAGQGRTAVRLSPNGMMNGVNDSDPQTLFASVARALSPLGLAFLEVREPPRTGTLGQADRDPIAPVIRAQYSGNLVINSDLEQSTAAAALEAGLADAASFGRLFISNPDLPRRFARGLPLTSYDKRTSYTQGAEGYIDYRAASD